MDLHILVNGSTKVPLYCGCDLFVVFLLEKVHTRLVKNIGYRQY